jgi:hypothetical protein
VLRTVTGVFIVLHGLVHLLYVGQSLRLFELQPDMVWPDGSWLLGHVLGVQAARGLASAVGVAATLGFAAGGAGLLFQGDWWRDTLMAAALLSMVIVVLFWNGRLEKIADQGLVALVIDALILGVLLFAYSPLSVG